MTPAVRGGERYKADYRSIHANQKPLKLLERIIRASSDPGDVVWDPFAGLGSVAIAAYRAGRRCYGAELLRSFHALAVRRVDAECARATSAA